MAYYTMEQLAKKVSLTPQTLYKLRRENEDYNKVVEANSKKRGRSVLYGEEVLAWLSEHYLANGIDNEPATPALEDMPASTSKLVEKWQAEKARLQAQVEELTRQNSQLLMLLSQEKMEKQALLPAPRVSVWERLFGRRKGE